jgi:hypothetical protein
LNAVRIFPEILNSCDAEMFRQPEDKYVCDLLGYSRPMVEVGFNQLLALRSGKMELTDQVACQLVRDFTGYDAFCQVVIVEALLGAERLELADAVMAQFDPQGIHGGDLPCRLAEAALAMRQTEMANQWLERGLEGIDPTVAVGYRNLLTCADLYHQAGNAKKAHKAFGAALDHIDKRQDAILRKASREVFTFCLHHIQFLPLTWGHKLHQAEWVSVGGAAFKGLARRLLRPLRSAG